MLTHLSTRRQLSLPLGLRFKYNRFLPGATRSPRLYRYNILGNMCIHERKSLLGILIGRTTVSQGLPMC
ncbi:hypothetical protein LZ31DRAFT_21375 [Colletotrichum somersetense]|nr:hypothetical protein LZ31DRAFT_21375 [Colletotrichum somersetense]